MYFCLTILAVAGRHEPVEHEDEIQDVFCLDDSLVSEDMTVFG